MSETLLIYRFKADTENNSLKISCLKIFTRLKRQENRSSVKQNWPFQNSVRISGNVVRNPKLKLENKVYFCLNMSVNSSKACYIWHTHNSLPNPFGYLDTYASLKPYTLHAYKYNCFENGKTERIADNSDILMHKLVRKHVLAIASTIRYTHTNECQSASNRMKMAKQQCFMENVSLCESL